MKVEYSEARRRPQKKKRRRLSKIGKIIIASAAVLVVVAITVTLMLTVFFNVSAVKVVGSSVYSYDEIIYASGIMNGDNLMRLPSDDIEARIEKALPFVKKAEIIKSYPDTVGIKVTPATESVLIETENGMYTADSDYKLLRTAADRPEGLLRIKGIEADTLKVGSTVEFNDKQQKKILNEILDICAENGFSVQFVNIASLVDIGFLIDSHIYVKLGSYNDLGAKMTHLAEAVKNFDKTAAASISLENWSVSSKESTMKYEDISKYIE